MSLTQEQIEQFKIDFEIQLGNFMAAREKEIGDPAQWKPKWHQYRNQIRFFRDGQEIVFSVKDFPDVESEDDKKTLRQAMYDICESQGFQPVNKSNLPPGTYDKVKQADPEAFEAFVKRHDHRLTRYAASQLGGKHNKTILEPKDISNIAYGKLWGYSQNGSLLKETTPLSFLSREIFQQATYAKKPSWLRRQPEGVDADTLPAESREPEAERAARIETLREQFPYIVEEARKHLSPAAQKALDIILQNEAEGGKPLSGLELGKRLGSINYGAAKMQGSRQFAAITEAIQRAAHRMGPDYEDAAAIIDQMVNGRKRSVER